MGLFDKLKKDLLNKAKKGLLDMVEGNLNTSAPATPHSSGKSTPYRPAPAPVKSATIPADAPAADAYSFQGTTEEYIYQILLTRFPGYQIQQQGNLSSDSTAVKPSFLVCGNGSIALVVIVCDKKLYGRKRLRITLDACQQRGIPVQCYYTQFRNEYNYVVQRLGQVLH